MVTETRFDVAILILLFNQLLLTRKRYCLRENNPRNFPQTRAAAEGTAAGVAAAAGSGTGAAAAGLGTGNASPGPEGRDSNSNFCPTCPPTRIPMLPRNG